MSRALHQFEELNHSSVGMITAECNLLQLLGLFFIVRFHPLHFLSLVQLKLFPFFLQLSQSLRQGGMDGGMEGVGWGDVCMLINMWLCYLLPFPPDSLQCCVLLSVPLYLSFQLCQPGLQVILQCFTWREDSGDHLGCRDKEAGQYTSVVYTYSESSVIRTPLVKCLKHFVWTSESSDK